VLGMAGICGLRQDLASTIWSQIAPKSSRFVDGMQGRCPGRDSTSYPRHVQLEVAYFYIWFNLA
jgi:hypothetical protein